MYILPVELDLVSDLGPHIEKKIFQTRMAGPPLQPHGGVENQERGGEAESQRWCAEEPCRRRPFFGNVGGKPLYCSQHAKTKDGMVDVSSRRCEAVGCAKWPLYGNEVRETTGRSGPCCLCFESNVPPCYVWASWPQRPFPNCTA